MRGMDIYSAAQQIGIWRILGHCDKEAHSISVYLSLRTSAHAGVVTEGNAFGAISIEFQASFRHTS